MTGIIFDFNGTMVFDEKFHTIAWEEFLEKRIGRKVTQEEMDKYVHGVNVIDTLRYFLKRDIEKDELKRLTIEKEAIYKDLCLKSNEYHLVDGLEEFLNYLKENKIPREDIFLISKVNNCNQGYEKTISSFKESLQKLQTEYLDAFLVHWPGQDKARMLDTWKAMEHLYKKGKVKSIGVCNFEISQLTYLLEHCEIKPMIDQVEHTPLMHDEKLISFCKENNIQIMSWGPLLRGNLENKKMEEIAEKYNKTTAQLLLRWNIQQGIIPIPKSKNEQRLQQNIDVFDFEITKEDMEELNHMNENHRTSFDPLTFDF